MRRIYHPNKALWLGLIIALCLALAGILNPAVPVIRAQVQGTDAPFLYRYTNDLNSFVVERADGTEPRLLAQNLMQSEKVELYDGPVTGLTISGPGWSPSGKYFAWTGVDMSNRFVTPYRAYMVNVDGSNPRRLLQDFTGNIRLVWFANPDRLLAIITDTFIREHYLWQSVVTLIVLDPETGNVLDRHNFTRTSYQHNAITVQPTFVEGKHGYLVQHYFAEDPENVVLWVMTINERGQVNERKYYEGNNNYRVVQPDYLYTQTPYSTTHISTIVSAQGDLLILENKALVIANVVTAEYSLVTANFTSDYKEGVNFIWSNDGNHAFIIVNKTGSHDGKLYLLSVAARAFMT